MFRISHKFRGVISVGHCETVEKVLFEHSSVVQDFCFLESFFPEGPIYLCHYFHNYPQTLYYLLKILLSHTIVYYFFYVMNHTVQNPLYVDFNFAPEGKAVQSLLGSDIGIYGFNNGNALRIYFASFFTVYLYKHCFGKIGFFSSDWNI